jgi:hypothetical protein
MSDEEKEEIDNTPQDDADHDSPDSEDGDSDDLPEGEHGDEAATKEDDEPIDVEALTRRAEAAEASSRETQAMLARILSGQNRDPQEEARKEREKVANMTADERALYIVDQAEARIRHITQQSEFKVQDANDRANFKDLCSKNPVAAKLAPEVEKRIAAERAKGYNFDREVMLKYVAGEKALQSAERGGSRRQKREAAENTKKSSTSATRAVGDKKLNGKIDPNSREARLERLKNARF